MSYLIWTHRSRPSRNGDCSSSHGRADFGTTDNQAVLYLVTGKIRYATDRAVSERTVESVFALPIGSNKDAYLSIVHHGLQSHHQPQVIRGPPSNTHIWVSPRAAPPSRTPIPPPLGYGGTGGYHPLRSGGCVEVGWD